MYLPRVKWEVAVRHVEGDADRPFVFGRVYNAVTPPPYGLPKAAAKSSMQTATTPGGGSSNEYRMSDTKGSEEVFFNASKDMTTHAKNDATEKIRNDYKKKVGFEPDPRGHRQPIGERRVEPEHLGLRQPDHRCRDVLCRPGCRERVVEHRGDVAT